MHLPISSKSYNAYKSLSINTSTQNITNTCYNLFLQQHNLPLLKENETLGSFLKHLFNHSFSQLILISINQTFTETHIYLNLKEPILKNHQILESNQFLTFCHLPIRTNKFQTPQINTELFTLTQQLTNSQNTQSQTNYSFTPTSNITAINTIENISLNINMASININGLSLPYKQLSLLDLINQNKYSIFGISETYLAIKEGRFLNKEILTYTSFWSSYTNSRQAGVGIFIHHSISKYIARSHNFNGHIVGVDLNFRNNPIRLLQVYFPTAEKKQL